MDIEGKRDSVLALFLSGKSNQEIVRALYNLNVNKSFVSRTIKRYNDTGSVRKRYGGGRQVTATTSQNVRKVKKRLERNPRRSVNQMAADIGVSPMSIYRILKNKLMVKPYKIQKVQELTDAQKKVRLDKAKQLKAMAARSELEDVVFTGEKVFTVPQFVNKQNDRVWLSDRSSINLDHLRAYRKQKPASVMVWAGITANGRTPLVFVPEN